MLSSVRKIRGRRLAFVNAIAVVTALALPACGGNSSPTSTPTAPSAPTAAAVAVTAAPSSGNTIQLTATARLSDGTARDVTSAAQWVSSDTTLAIVASTGLATIQGSGEVEFRATYQTVTGSMRVFVTQSPPPTKFTLSGIVHEAGTTKLLEGVRFLVSVGPDAGASAVSDATGMFTFPSLAAGVISLEGAKDGYIEARLSNLSISHNQTIDFALYLTPPRDANGATATARCNDGSWSWGQTRDQVCTSNGGIAYGVCPGPLCY
jgi:hypothetical protein